MENLAFNISINASTQKVWDTLFTDVNYPKWTTVFCEGSHAVTNWQQGSKALFLDNKGAGMVAILDQVAPNQFMSIKCLGEIKNGAEDFNSPGAQTCSGAIEQYTLKANDDGSTLLTVELSGGNFPDNLLDFFNGVWPKALDAVKAIAEEG